MNWEDFEILVLETTWIRDFFQISLFLWNWLVLLIRFVIVYCYLICVMINWSICWDFWNWVFQSLGFVPKLYVQANSMFWKSIWTILNALEHASCVYYVHASYRLFFSIFFALTLSDAVCPWVFFVFLSLVLFCLSYSNLSIMTRKTRANRKTTSSSTPAFECDRFHTEKNQENFEKLNIFKSVWAERKVVLDELD